MDNIILGIVIFCFEVVGTIAFAISGAMTAIENKLDLFGIFVLAGVTATGGGIIRDIILGNTPPAAFEKPIYLIIASMTVIVFLVFNKFLKEKYSLQIMINIFDAFGLGIFCIVGIDTALAAGFVDNMFLSVFVGVCTGIGGGIMRDLLVGRKAQVLYKYLYAVPAILGSCIYFLMVKTGYSIAAIVVGISVIVIFRFLAMHKKMSLPKIN